MTLDDLNTEQKKMLKRVQGLLTKAEDDAATPEESAALTAKAAEILMKYNIDAALAAAKADAREVPCDKVIEFEQPYSKAHAWFYVAILREFGGDAVIIQKPTRNRGRYNVDSYKLRVYAFEADLMAVDILYTSLMFQASNQLKHPPAYEHAKTWRSSFWAGYQQIITERLKAANATVVEATKEPGTAIVLRDRKAVVQAKKELDYPKLRTVQGPGARSRHGFEAGKEAGRRANLHDRDNVGGQQRRTALC